MDYFVHSAADGRLSKSVIYSSDFMGQYSDVQTTDVSKCQLEGCTAGSEARKNNPELDTFCTAAKQTVYLGNNYELYQVNMFGNIEKRLTTNDFFDGEPSISLNNRLVYTQVGDSRTDLVVRWLDYPKSKSRVSVFVAKESFKSLQINIHSNSRSLLACCRSATTAALRFLQIRNGLSSMELKPEKMSTLSRNS